MTTIPSDEELKSAVYHLLKNSDLTKTTLRVIISTLADQFEISPGDLSDRKGYLRQVTKNYLENQFAQDDPSPPPSPKRTATTTTTNTTSKSSKRKSSSNSNDTNKPVKLTGLEKAVVLAEPLAQFLGEVVISRSQITKRITSYAKENGLQDPSDGRRILCDEALKSALGVDDFTFFSVAKLITGLVYKPEECSEELQELAKKCEEEILAEKIRKKEMEPANGTNNARNSDKRETKKQKTKSNSDKPRKPSALMKPMLLSEELQAVCGESKLSRPEVMKKIWDYIKGNQLRDPDNSQRILCDDKLKAIFDGSETVANMGINKYLSAHLSKVE